MEKSLVRLSKFISLVLRHKPETIGISLDQQGWVEIDVLLDAAQQHGREISRAELEAVVAQNDKQRFIIQDNRIRANQGHSIEIELGLTPVVPPEILYHGTAERFLAEIRLQGLLKMRRQHVHLSATVDTAVKVGQRHGKPVVLTIQAQRMHDDGHTFFLSENSVWLTDHVPASFIDKG